MTRALNVDIIKTFSPTATVRCRFVHPLDGFSITVLFGPSGCGKTTVLRALAGLEMPEAGTIHFGDETWFNAAEKKNLPPQQRRIGLTFQEPLLFPHLNVRDNIGFGLIHVSSDERRRRIAELLELVQLGPQQDQFPAQLSGGQKQRAALARSLAPAPRLLLLDEPLSALDAAARDELRQQLRKLLRTANTPAIVVTHDHLEAMTLADQVVVMNQEGVLQSGPVQDVFTRPANLEAAKIVGIETLLPARVLSIDNDLATVQAGAAKLYAHAPGAAAGEVFLCIRAEEVILQKQPAAQVSARNQLQGTVVAITSQGTLLRVELDCGFRLAALITRSAREDLSLYEGAPVTALLKAPALHLISRG